MYAPDEEIKIELITDEHELCRKGHTSPAIELYNDYHCVWIPKKDVSYHTLERELNRITKLTRQAAEGDI